MVPWAGLAHSGYKGNMQAQLLEWYRREARSLPWREQPGPYRTWLSEIMLQQTRVAAVVPYFEAFVARWPTVQGLARAPLEDVLGAWSGLGYYSRARNLHRAAQVVADRGAFPTTAKELESLPGVGRYTAGAIASIAMGQDAPLVDGNVERVLSRLFRLEEDPRSPQGKRALWQLAEKLLVRGSAGDWNQALMELGALVCLPGTPDCPNCPVASHCASHGTPFAQSLPNKARRKRPKKIHGACVVITREDGAVLLQRRPEKGLLATMWGPPGPSTTEKPQAQASLLNWAAGQDGDLHIQTRVGEIRHVFTHRDLTMGIWRGDWSHAPVGEHLAWTRHLEGLALSSLDLKCLALAGIHPA
jgi:A/G-specific adenine glycosylase